MADKRAHRDTARPRRKIALMRKIRTPSRCRSALPARESVPIATVCASAPSGADFAAQSEQMPSTVETNAEKHVSPRLTAPSGSFLTDARATIAVAAKESKRDRIPSVRIDSVRPTTAIASFADARGPRRRRPRQTSTPSPSRAPRTRAQHRAVQRRGCVFVVLALERQPDHPPSESSGGGARPTSVAAVRACVDRRVTA